MLEPDPALYPALLERYSEPHRKYHTLQHLDECLAKLPEVRELASHPAEIEVALWFHDAVYSVLRHDNEEKSAEWACASIQKAGLPQEVGNRVHSLIMATRHRAVPTDLDAAILVDVDLSILGAPRARFEQYERQIREEYSYVPTFLFSKKRAQILQEFFDRPRIFTTPIFFERYERQARENLQASLKSALG
ncbi:hypothetical protein [Paraherbaspirillum soli]|uniref:N-methyl-D-aspartate receptor NMDAR2C subunit n=1 Tax=Paraherbaspirillum soli TaxID=631222 RepID=A0ABW0MA37_9BURK